jgi:hypothetical protein
MTPMMGTGRWADHTDAPLSISMTAGTGDHEHLARHA